MKTHAGLARTALAAALLLAAATLHAQETEAGTGAGAGDDAELEALMGVLAEETEIATKTRQNADYVPGIVSVLHADEAKLLGARTVHDALALIPGIEVNRDERGSATLRVRGADFFFNGGNVKVLVDSLAISRETAFQNSAILLMPIEQVERIEVIRGPGAGIHGDFAFVGLVNIVTHHDRNAISAVAGSGDRRSAVWSYATDAGKPGPSLSGSFSRWSSNRFDGPGQADADDDRRYASFALAKGGFSLKVAAIDRHMTRIAPAPPPSLPGSTLLLLQDESSLITELRYGWERDAEHRSAVWFNHQDNDFQRENSGFRGSRWELGGDLMRRVGKHLLFAQATIAELGIDDAYDLNARPGTLPVIDVHESRDYLSLSIQDQYDFGERFSITGGFRYDDLDGIDSLVSPRLSALWRIDDRHTLKAQYAEGFRSPHFLEMYRAGPPPASGIPFEKIRTHELAYIYRTPKMVFRATAFQSRIDDLIFPRDTPAFEQGYVIKAKGIELELTRQLSDWLKLVATLSGVDTVDQRRTPANSPVFVDDPSIGEPESLGNLALIARANAQWSFGLHWNHVGDRESIGAKEPGYNLLSLGAVWRPSAIEGLQLRMNLRNATDDEVINLTSMGTNRAIRHDYGGQLWSMALEWDY